MRVHAMAQNLVGNDNPHTHIALKRTAISPGPTADIAPRAVADVVRSSGRALESATRASMELGFGQDFSRVRVHDDHTAAASARSVDARAYTVGNHIAFDTGQYRPDTPEGHRLLAHELAHVLQQSPLGLSASEPTLAGHAEKSAEHDAESAVQQMVRGFPARPTMQMTPGVLARQPNSEKEPGIFSLDTIVGGLKGEFNEDPKVGEIAVDTIVSLVPGLDQVADARDLAAHLYFMAIERQYDKSTRWIGLAFTLIGVIPEVGSAVKSVSKFLIKGMREALTHLDDILKIIRRVLPEISEVGKLRRYINAHWSTWVKTGTEFFNRVIARLTTAATNGSFLARRVLGRFRGALEMLLDIAPGRLRHAYDDVKRLLDDVLSQLSEHLSIRKADAPKARNTPKPGSAPGRDAAQAEGTGLFYKPKVQPDETLPAAWGETNKYGDVWYSPHGSASDIAVARYHEAVHSALSPKFKYFREFRADLAIKGYKKSQFLKYLEEALAETYAQLRVNGIKGLPSGIQFPLKNGYVTLKGVVKEAAIGTVAVGGTTYGVYVVVTDTDENGDE